MLIAVAIAIIAKGHFLVGCFRAIIHLNHLDFPTTIKVPKLVKVITLFVIIILPKFNSVHQ